jgi:type VI secretion system secreted protein Hcp
MPLLLNHAYSSSSESFAQRRSVFPTSPDANVYGAKKLVCFQGPPSADGTTSRAASTHSTTTTHRNRISTSSPTPVSTVCRRAREYKPRNEGLERRRPRVRRFRPNAKTNAEGEVVPYEFYISIKGQKQGQFKGDSTEGKAKGAKGVAKIRGVRFTTETVSPRDPASGLATGKRQHKPIMITKEWDATSPQIFNALVNNELLTNVVFEFVKTDQLGHTYVYHTITLTDASVSDVKSYLDLTDTTGDPYDGHELEDVYFTFRKIEMENKDGKTMAEDDWESPLV